MYRKLTRVTHNLYQVLDMKNDAANGGQHSKKGGQKQRK